MRVPLTFRLSGAVRLIAAGVAVAALAANFQYVLGFSTFAALNYFSYFTQQSNMANVVVLIVSGVLTLRGRTDPPWFAVVHAVVTTYVVVSGVVFAVIVTQSASHHYALAFPTSSQILHFWMSGYLVLDWILAPGRTPLRCRMLWLVLPFPLVWGVFTILRGRQVRWYPYFFLDPAQVSTGQFRLYNAIVLAIFLAVASFLIVLSHLRPWHLTRHRRGAGTAPTAAGLAVSGAPADPARPSGVGVDAGTGPAQPPGGGVAQPPGVGVGEGDGDSVAGTTSR